MKNTITFLALLLICAGLRGQAPELLSYQAVVRDAGNALVTNQAVGVRISLLQYSPSGLAVYIERHSAASNDNGLVSLEIGNGTPEAGSFTAIDWTDGPYFLRTETDPLGGTTYTISGTSQLLSVPYALHAATAGSANEADPVFGGSVAAGITAADTAAWNADQVDDADADPANELQSLTLSGDTLSIQNGNAVVLPQDSAVWTKVDDTVFYNGGNVGIGSSSPAAKLEVNGDFIRTVAYATGNGPDDPLDNGQVVSRVLNFTKKRDDTKIRISYTDNFRVVSWGGGSSNACSWELRIDGLSCPSQVLQYNEYVASGNTLNNLHKSQSIVGYCDMVPAGNHQIQVWVGGVNTWPQSDCFTGWFNSTWVIEVEEVF